MILLSSLLGCIVAGDPLEPIGRISDPTILETSGIVASRKHPGVFWVQSDSGNPPAVHAIRRDGRVLRSFRVAAPNVDWEDIATDDRGHLYLGDIGNNNELLPIRAVYRIDEPDPSRPPAGDLPVTASIYYKFAARKDRFDAESLFVADRAAFLISKRRDGRPAELFRLPLDRPAPLLRPAGLERVGPVPGFVEPATGAGLSADGRRLAVASNTATRVYDRGVDGGLTPRVTVRYKGRDVEAIAWDGLDLVLATEAGELFKIASTTWMERGAPPSAGPP